MKKSFYFFLTALALSSILGGLFLSPVAYAFGVALAVILWNGLRKLKFEKTLRVIPWPLLALALPFLYSLILARGMIEIKALTTLPLIFIAAFFEETGWRGFLFKELENFGWLKINLIIGFLWGIWHLPAILTNHYPIISPFVPGLLLFFLNVILLSFLFGWFRQKTGGLWAPVLFHASHNFVTTGIVESSWRLTVILLVTLFIFHAWEEPNEQNSR